MVVHTQSWSSWSLWVSCSPWQPQILDHPIPEPPERLRRRSTWQFPCKLLPGSNDNSHPQHFKLQIMLPFTTNTHDISVKGKGQRILLNTTHINTSTWTPPVNPPIQRIPRIPDVQAPSVVATVGIPVRVDVIHQPWPRKQGPRQNPNTPKCD